MKNSLIMCCILFFAGGLACSSSKSSNNDTITIGLMLPIISEKDWSSSQEKAALLALEEINATGGINGKKVILKTVDDGRADGSSVTVAKTLIEEEKAVAIIGPTSSSLVIDVANGAAIPLNIPVISPSGTSDAITQLQDNNCIWRTVPQNSMQAKVLAPYILNTIKKSSASVLFVESAYGKDLAAQFKTAFPELGGTMVSEVSFKEPEGGDYTNFDFDKILTELFLKPTSTIFIIVNSDPGTYIMTAIANNAESYFKDFPELPLFIGSDTLFSTTFAENSPGNSNGMLVIAPGNRDRELYKTFQQQYSNKYGSLETENGYVENTYDAVFLLGLAFVEGNSVVADIIKTHLLSVSKSGEKIKIGEFAKARKLIEQGTDIDYEGTSGPVDFDEKGDIFSAPFTIYQIDNKQFVKKDIL